MSEPTPISRARVDVEPIKAALADPELVIRLFQLKARREGAGFKALCVGHDEKSPSLSITRGACGTARFHCFAGCGLSGDVYTFAAALWRLDAGRDFPELHRRLAELAGVASNELPCVEPRVTATSTAPAIADDRFAAIVAPLLHALDETAFAVDVTRYVASRGLAEEAGALAALPPAGPVQRSLARVLADNFDADELERSGLLRRGRGGLELLRPAHRLLIPWRTPAGAAYTCQRRLLGDGQPKYVFPKGRGPRWPFGIERMATTDAAVPIAFCEGALDALARRILDRRQGVARLALGVPGVDGWRKDWAKLARGRIAFVATDADDAGDRVVELWTRDLYGAGATQVRRLRPTGAKDWTEVLC